MSLLRFSYCLHLLMPRPPAPAALSYNLGPGSPFTYIYTFTTPYMVIRVWRGAIIVIVLCLLVRCCCCFPFFF